MYNVAVFLFFWVVTLALTRTLLFDAFWRKHGSHLGRTSHGSVAASSSYISKLWE